MAGFDFSQQQTQTQQQILSQRQLQSLEILSYGSDDLREAVYKAAEENPALAVTKDSTANIRLGPRDYTRTSSRVSSEANLASDNFEAALEAKADERESLQEHLLTQFRVLRLTEKEIALGENLIRNLDDHGFHILAPESFLGNSNSSDEKNLKKILGIIQSLDPVGCCTANIKESLFVQAELSENAPALAKFILDGHLDFLEPPLETKVIKKITSFLREQKNLFAQKEIKYLPQAEDLTEEGVKNAISFIRTLDPFPARNFSTSHTHFISPDIYVEKLPEPQDETNLEKGIITFEKNGQKTSWRVRLSNENVPELSLDSSFKKFSETENSVSKGEKKIVQQSIKKAEDFIEALKYRQNTLMRAACRIVLHQADFFLSGPGNLKPLKQLDLAEELGVHETTVSRLSNSKYIQCEWGLFEFKYFFTTSVSRTKEAAKADTFTTGNSEDLSREKVLFIIKEILEEHKDDKKKLSDQKLSDLLEQKGIKVARRTVAKYRAMLNIDSSYNR